MLIIRAKILSIQRRIKFLKENLERLEDAPSPVQGITILFTFKFCKYSAEFSTKIFILCRDYRYVEAINNGNCLHFSMHIFHIVGSHQTRYRILLAHIFHTVVYISYRITMGIISMRFWLLFFLLLLYTSREAKLSIWNLGFSQYCTFLVSS